MLWTAVALQVLAPVDSPTAPFVFGRAPGASDELGTSKEPFAADGDDAGVGVTDLPPRSPVPPPTVEDLQAQLELKTWQLEQLRVRLYPQLASLVDTLADKERRRKERLAPGAIVADRGVGDDNPPL